MSGVAVSKERVRQMLQSDREEREALVHHTERLREHSKRLDNLEAWAGAFEKIGAWKRIRWVLTGR